MNMGSWSPLQASSLGAPRTSHPDPNSTRNVSSQPFQGPPESLLHAVCGGHHGQDLAQLVEGAGREGFLEEEVPE